jgi:hypothetical protein
MSDSGCDGHASPVTGFMLIISQRVHSLACEKFAKRRPLSWLMIENLSHASSWKGEIVSCKEA